MRSLQPRGRVGELQCMRQWGIRERHGLARWARRDSHQKPAALKMPPLRRSPNADPIAVTHAEKAEVLRQQFFPLSPAVLDDIQETTFEDRSFGSGFQVDQAVTPGQVARAIRSKGPWKAPGPDGIPTGFLRACGEPLHRVLARLIQACLKMEYFPALFRQAKVVTLRKPGKPRRQLEEAEGWRPIALLNTVGKVMETIVCERITEAAEKHGLLPANQMGNRKNRSTELAVRLLIDQIRTAWSYRAITSLLQLDIKGAFDTVCHLRLLDTLRKMGFPPWLTRWIRSYLTDRKATLVFDDEETEPMSPYTGVPQGSPLSPILFILYITSLYKELGKMAGISVIEFADDTNILAFGRTARENRLTLEQAWRICTRWAESHGMQFAPAKSELVHFTRSRQMPLDHIHLGTVELKPKSSTRFLGVWVDRKLMWKTHLKEVRKRLETQCLALTRLAASTWGFSLVKAREVYTKVIRSAIAYGASAFHRINPEASRPQGITKELSKEQASCLRTVTGAFKATATRALEAEAFVPPLDIYLNSRVARFEKRLQSSGIDDLINNNCSAVAQRLRNRCRRRRRGRSPEPQAMAQSGPAEQAERWLATASDDPMRRTISGLELR